jgi:DNA-binding Lrp family transcriptional regulator
MESGGIIKDYAMLLDQEKLGYELTVVTEITVSKGSYLSCICANCDSGDVFGERQIVNSVR